MPLNSLTLCRRPPYAHGGESRLELGVSTLFFGDKGKVFEEESDKKTLSSSRSLFSSLRGHSGLGIYFTIYHSNSLHFFLRRISVYTRKNVCPIPALFMLCYLPAMKCVPSLGRRAEVSRAIFIGLPNEKSINIQSQQRVTN